MKPWAVGALVVLAACPEPNDVLYTPTTAPFEVSPGLFQLTFTSYPENARGFTPDGDSVLFQAIRNYQNGTASELLAVPLNGGPAIEEAQLYRLALRRPLGTIVSRTGDRLLTWYQAGNDGLFFGPAGCPGVLTLPAWHLTILRLGDVDGAALSNIPQWLVDTRTADTVANTAGLLEVGVRFTLGQSEADSGRNPFGPAIASSGTTAYYSDGEHVWRRDIADQQSAPVDLGPGIFPNVSADGTMLAVAVPGGVDSVFKQNAVAAGIRTCRQDMWTLTAATWTSVITKPATGDTVRQVSGTEPVLDPSHNRVIVRRPTGLWQVDLTSGAESVIGGTFGASGASVSPDGKTLAFSLVVNKTTRDANVYFVKLD